MILQVIVNGTISFAIIALVAASFSVIYSTCRFFHLAHGGVYVIGAYVTYFLYRNHFPYLLALAGATVISAVAGMAMERLVYRPMRMGKASGLAFLLASLGLLISVQSLFAIIFGNETRQLWYRPEVKPGVSFLGARITIEQLWLLAGASLFFFVLLGFMRSTMGQRLRAVADNSSLAQSVGIELDQVFIVTFALGSALGGAAGGLISLQEVISPFMGFSAVLYGILAAMIGGLGNIKGTILASLLLGMVVSGGVTFVSPAWKDTLALIVLMVVLFIRPRGLKA